MLRRKRYENCLLYTSDVERRGSLPDSLFLLALESVGASEFGSSNNYAESDLKKAVDKWLEDMGKRGLDNAKPVSYTHLDVYKRQTRGRRHSPASQPSTFMAYFTGMGFTSQNKASASGSISSCSSRAFAVSPSKNALQRCV